MGIDKLLQNYAKPLTLAINCFLRQGTFPDSAKTASAFPLDKGKSNKFDFLNYGLVGILKAFLYDIRKR